MVMEKTETLVSMDELVPIIREVISMGRSVQIFPRGISMLPMLRQVIDSVVLAPVPPKLKRYDIPLYRRDNGQYVLHRIVRVDDTYTCVGDNQFIAEPGLRHDQMIAVVTAFYSGNKKHDITETGYLLYCYLWDYSRVFRRFFVRAWGWLSRHVKASAGKQ